VSVRPNSIAQQAMPHRRLIMLLDGTWNDSQFSATDTNIVRLQRLISLNSNASVVAPPYAGQPPNSSERLVTSSSSEGVSNIVFYERGVGTGTLVDRILGGAVGSGLDGNVRRAYRFLSFHYRPDDQIYIFGFSRGSYTARSLIGYIAAAGLLRREHCTAENERTAWDFYRTRPNDRLPGVWEKLAPLVHDRDRVRIECLGVFDTVGALGVPIEAFARVNRERFEFHSVELSSITKVNLQALALDENRWPFQATLWRKPPFKKFSTVIEQVWFSGAHSDVGGGYINELERGGSQYLDDITLDWMLRRVQYHCSDFIKLPNIISPATAAKTAAAAPAKPYAGEELAHNSRLGVYRLYPKSWRAIANTPVAPQYLKTRQVYVGHDRQASPIHEMVHASAIERLRRKRYAPANLLSILPSLKTVYEEPPIEQPPVHLVNWDGAVLNPYHQGDKALANDIFARVKA
jgi:hypothetical protein